MPALSASHHAALAAVAEGCPDAALAQLAAAVGAMPGDRAQAVAALLADERSSRRRRAMVFQPLLPMFEPRSDEVAGLIFPRQVLARLWRLVIKDEAELAERLDHGGPESEAAADQLCLAAAARVRKTPQVVWPDAPKGMTRELAGCLELASLARRALPLLHVWLERPDPNQEAELRLLIRDSDEIADEGGRRMVDILFSHVADAERMLRVVTRTSRLADRELMLSHSEMGVFVDRLLASVERRAARIARVRPSGDEAAAERLKADMGWCAAVLEEMDLTLQMRPDSPWGRSARMARVKVAGQVSRLLQTAAATTHAALPLHSRRLVGRMKRMAPWLEAPTTGEAIDTATALLGLTSALRPAAQVFGCEAERTRLRLELTDYLSTYANEVLDSIADGEAERPNHALRLVGHAARFLTLLDALEAARAVRRRASAAEAALAAEGASPAAA